MRGKPVAYEPCAGCIDPSLRKARLRMTTVREVDSARVILKPTFCVGRWIYATGAEADWDLLLRSKSHRDQLGYARFLHRHTI